MKKHEFTTQVTWTGNKGNGSIAYEAYGRDYRVEAKGKQPIDLSADALFRGDAEKYNPEDMLLASLSACHMLWYLHLCADAGVVVMNYVDHVSGILEFGGERAGKFTEVTLKPRIGITSGSDKNKAEQLHHKAHEKCFIANSCNFEIKIEPEFWVLPGN